MTSVVMLQPKGDPYPVDGMVFHVDRSTIDESLRTMLFGMSAARFKVVRRIRIGAAIFLYDLHNMVFHGVFEAVSPGCLNLDPEAFGGSSQGGSKYPAQVQCVRSERYPAAHWWLFENVPGLFYAGTNKVDPMLNIEQVECMREVFRQNTERIVHRLGPPAACPRLKPQLGPPLGPDDRLLPYTRPYGGPLDSYICKILSPDFYNKYEGPEFFDPIDDGFFTTVVLKNLPEGLTGDLLVDSLDQAGYHLCYDFLMIKESTAGRAGYARINFTSRRSAEAIFPGIPDVQEFWPPFNLGPLKQKPVSWARQQGSHGILNESGYSILEVEGEPAKFHIKNLQSYAFKLPQHREYEGPPVDNYSHSGGQLSPTGGRNLPSAGPSDDEIEEGELDEGELPPENAIHQSGGQQSCQEQPELRSDFLSKATRNGSAPRQIKLEPRDPESGKAHKGRGDDHTASQSDRRRSSPSSRDEALTATYGLSSEGLGYHRESRSGYNQWTRERDRDPYDAAEINGDAYKRRAETASPDSEYRASKRHRSGARQTQSNHQGSELTSNNQSRSSRRSPSPDRLPRRKSRRQAEERGLSPGLWGRRRSPERGEHYSEKRRRSGSRGRSKSLRRSGHGDRPRGCSPDRSDRRSYRMERPFQRWTPEADSIEQELHHSDTEMTNSRASPDGRSRDKSRLGQRHKSPIKLREPETEPRESHGKEFGDTYGKRVYEPESQTIIIRNYSKDRKRSSMVPVKTVLPKPPPKIRKVQEPDSQAADRESREQTTEAKEKPNGVERSSGKQATPDALNPAPSSQDQGGAATVITKAPQAREPVPVSGQESKLLEAQANPPQSPESSQAAVQEIKREQNDERSVNPGQSAPMKQPVSPSSQKSNLPGEAEKKSRKIVWIPRDRTPEIKLPTHKLEDSQKRRMEIDLKAKKDAERDRWKKSDHRKDQKPQAEHRQAQKQAADMMANEKPAEKGSAPSTAGKKGATSKSHGEGPKERGLRQESKLSEVPAKNKQRAEVHAKDKDRHKTRDSLRAVEKTPVLTSEKRKAEGMQRAEPGRLVKEKPRAEEQQRTEKQAQAVQATDSTVMPREVTAAQQKAEREAYLKHILEKHKNATPLEWASDGQGGIFPIWKANNLNKKALKGLRKQWLQNQQWYTAKTREAGQSKPTPPDLSKSDTHKGELPQTRVPSPSLPSNEELPPPPPRPPLLPPRPDSQLPPAFIWPPAPPQGPPQPGSQQAATVQLPRPEFSHVNGLPFPPGFFPSDPQPSGLRLPPDWPPKPSPADESGGVPDQSSRAVERSPQNRKEPLTETSAPAVSEPLEGRSVPAQQWKQKPGEPSSEAVSHREVAENASGNSDEIEPKAGSPEKTALAPSQHENEIDKDFEDIIDPEIELGADFIEL